MKKPEVAKNLTQQDPSEIPLNETEQALFAQLRTEAAAIQQQANSLLAVVLRQKQLQGNWALEGDKLVRAPVAPPTK
jgi:hypothetical protein